VSAGVGDEMIDEVVGNFALALHAHEGARVARASAALLEGGALEYATLAPLSSAATAAAMPPIPQPTTTTSKSLIPYGMFSVRPQW